MEKINIAELLKDKPKGTKLYSTFYGYVELVGVENSYIQVSVYDNKGQYGTILFNQYGQAYNYRKGEVCLFPSKRQRDWSKFAWEKGDILKAGVDNFCIFESWGNSKYTEFNANYVTDRYSGEVLETKDWHKETNENIIKQYIDKIEEIKGGKLNLETLEIEKPKFKNGDIVVSKECEFEPFQKVLVRDSEVDKWYPDFFNQKNDKSNFPYETITRRLSKYCIPYNDETKHLLGTTDEWKGGNV